MPEVLKNASASHQATGATNQTTQILTNQEFTSSTEANEVNSEVNSIVVCAMYKFVTISDYIDLQPKVLAKLNELKIRGTLLLANEGINGTISGLELSVSAFLSWLQEDKRFKNIDHKISFHDQQPFNRTKVKLKKEIVTMGVEGIDPNQVVGTYVEPKDWNELIADPDTVLIDTRNEYENNIGTFKNALNPHTKTFREFPEYVEKNLIQVNIRK